MEVSAIILRRPTGQYFVHQRRADKKMFPGLFGLGAGGKLNSGETAQNAAQRELREETGIVAQPHWLFTFPYRYQEMEYQLHVFELVTEDSVVFDGSEWQGGFWVEPEEVEKLAKENQLCPDTAIFYERYRTKINV